MLMLSNTSGLTIVHFQNCRRSLPAPVALVCKGSIPTKPLHVTFVDNTFQVCNIYCRIRPGLMLIGWLPFRLCQRLRSTGHTLSTVCHNVVTVMRSLLELRPSRNTLGGPALSSMTKLILNSCPTVKPVMSIARGTLDCHATLGTACGLSANASPRMEKCPSLRLIQSLSLSVLCAVRSMA